MNELQKRAVDNHRRRLRERGMARYEVRGLESDKALVRRLATRLAENDARPTACGRNLRERFRSEAFFALEQEKIFGTPCIVRRWWAPIWT